MLPWHLFGWDNLLKSKAKKKKKFEINQNLNLGKVEIISLFKLRVNYDAISKLALEQYSDI